MVAISDRCERVEPPEEVASGIIALMRQLDLVYGHSILSFHLTWYGNFWKSTPAGNSDGWKTPSVFR